MVRRSLGIAALGLAGILSGCKSDGSPDLSINTERAFPLLLRGLAPFAAERDPVRGAALYNIGDEAGRQLAAREGRTQVTVNTYQGSDRQIASNTPNLQENSDSQYIGTNFKQDNVYGLLTFATFRDSADLNGDHFLAFPREFAGISDTFSSNSKISVIGGATVNIEDLRYELFDSQGNIVDKANVRTDYGVARTQSLRCIYNSESNRPVKLEPGKYDAVYYSGDRKLGDISFTVVPEKQK